MADKPGQLLLAVAAPAECRAILGRDVEPWHPVEAGPGVQLVMSGVGKANAAGAVARFADPSRHAGVISLGISGTYGGPALLDIVIATASAFADEGVQNRDLFEDLASRGFSPWGGPGCSVPTDARLASWARESLGSLPAGLFSGPVATVSVCSGQDALAAAFKARTGAIAEAMEGAAAGASAARLGIPFCEVRVISNTTGDRPSQRWDMKGSMQRLGEVGRRLIETAARFSPGPN